MKFTMLDKVVAFGIKANEAWDEVHPTAKPIASGLAILLGLMLHKIFVACGVILFFGSRASYEAGILKNMKPKKENHESTKDFNTQR